MHKLSLEFITKKILGLSLTGESEGLFIGHYCLKEDPSLTLLVLNEFAKKTKLIPSYEEFEDLYRDKKFDGKKPDIDDPRFRINSANLPPNLQQYKRIFFYNLAQKAYEKKLRNYEKFNRRRKAIAQGVRPSVERYLSFVCNPAFETGSKELPKSLSRDDRTFFSRMHPFCLKDEDRAKHTYITGQPGHGKSKTMETMISWYVSKKEPQEAIIVLDPHNDFATDCAMLLPNRDNNRVVYIKPALDLNFTPTLNPLSLKSNNWDVLNKASDSIIGVFQELMNADKDGQPFTQQMKTLLRPCLVTLLQIKSATFLTLLDFLSDDKNLCMPYLETAEKVLTNKMQLSTIKADKWFSTGYKTSRQSIATKIVSLLSDDYFYNFLVGESTFDLEEAIENKSVIIFDLSSLSEKAKEDIGRFIIASITNIALARADIPKHLRTPTHFFIDECHNFLSKSLQTVMDEARKFKLHGTLAQQRVGQKMDTNTKESVIGSSFIKIGGKNSPGHGKIMQEQMRVKAEYFDCLVPGENYVKAGDKPAVKIKIPMVTDEEKMSAKELEIIIEDQKNRFYRPIFEQDNKPLTLSSEKSENTPHRKPQNLQSSEKIIYNVKQSPKLPNF